MVVVEQLSDSEALGLKRRRWSGDELRSLQALGVLGDRGGYELLDGDLVEKGSDRRRSWTSEEIQVMVEAGLFVGPPSYELLNGELFEMAPEGPLHVHAKKRLTRWLMTRASADVDVVPDSPLRLAEKVEPEPDVWLHPASLDSKDVRGSDTLLVIEVADSSVSRDRLVKSTLYASHRVPLYWVLDVAARETWVYRLQGVAYGEPEIVSFEIDLEAPTIAEPLNLADLLR